MSSLTVDSLIYYALFSFDLHNSFFQSYNQPIDNANMDGLRNIFKMAACKIFSIFPSDYCIKTISISQEPNLENGWYRAPSDLVEWISPMPQEKKLTSDNIPIFKLSSSSDSSGNIAIQYIYYIEDFTGCPIEVIDAVQALFIFQLRTRNIFSPDKIAAAEVNVKMTQQNLQVKKDYLDNNKFRF